MPDQVEVPAEARALITLREPDYGDAHVVATERARQRSAEEWARLIFDGAPAAARASLVAGWSTLGLKLSAAPSDARILGWEVRRSTDDHVLLGAGSRLGMPAELLLVRRPEELLFATFVRQENAAMRALWAGIVPFHVRVVRQVIGRAER